MDGLSTDHDRGVSAGPVLYLDVDGVLNALDARRSRWPDVVTVHETPVPGGRAYQLHLSAAMGAALAALEVEIRWATTWAHAAGPCISHHVGLPPDLAVSCTPDDPASHFKGEAIRAEVEAERRPFIWVDDEAISRTWKRWAAQVRDDGVPNLLVEPDTRRGLTPDDVERMATWVASLER